MIVNNSLIRILYLSKRGFILEERRHFLGARKTVNIVLCSMDGWMDGWSIKEKILLSKPIVRFFVPLKNGFNKYDGFERKKLKKETRIISYKLINARHLNKTRRHLNEVFDSQWLLIAKVFVEILFCSVARFAGQLLRQRQFSLICLILQIFQFACFLILYSF